MSKLFFKGRIDARQNHVMSGYNVNRDIKLGTKEAPITLVVSTEERKAEIEAMAAAQSIVAQINVEPDQAENIVELELLLNKPKSITVDKTPNRNDVCLCGSGKKYKKCCG
jgi:SWIM/SEC-C metal-binding protein